VRITVPSPESRVPLDKINLTEVRLYTHGDAHLAWQTLRAECPVFWQQKSEGEGFWAVTRRADVRRVLADHETFSSEGGTALAMLDASDPGAGLMMHSTDPPRHRYFREQFSKPFSGQTVATYTDGVRKHVMKVASTATEDATWDAADAFARLPVAVAGTLMGLPSADIEPLLRLCYEALAPLDVRYSREPSKSAATAAHWEIIEYFAKCIDQRRRRSGDDLISYLLAIEVAGEGMTEQELLSNCLSLLLGAVITTSQAISATLLAMLDHHGGEAHWAPRAPVTLMVEEALRWSSPVTHFMRRARRDTEICGQRIQAGEAVTAWIASANRDESVFEVPYTLDFVRSPNPHIAFGFGPHRCLGSHLARLMLHLSFTELIARIECFELSGSPRHLASNEIAGLVNLPLRLKLRRVT